MSTSATLRARIVGPLDKRRRVTRCISCAKRRIKCEGGFPCASCIRQNTTCVAQKQSGYGMAVFVNQTQQDDFGDTHRSSDQKSRTIKNKHFSGIHPLDFIGKDKAKENKELRAENEKKKQKRTRSRRHIPSEEGLSVEEASALIIQQQEAIEAPPPGPGIQGESAIQPRTRPPGGVGYADYQGIEEKHVQIDQLVS